MHSFINKVTMKIFLALVSLVVTFHNANSAKILGVFSMPSRSHHRLGSSLMKGLAEQGHDVTIITPYIEKDLPKKGSYRQIALTGFEEAHEGNCFPSNDFIYLIKKIDSASQGNENV